jgi:hypothetical protein
MAYRAVLFDVDDTLIRRDDIPGQLAASARFCIEKAQAIYPHLTVPEDKLSENWIRGQYGNTIPWYMTEFLGAAGLPENELPAYVDIGVNDYFRRIEETAPECNLFYDVLPR